VRLRNLWVGRKYICEIRDGFELPPRTLHNYDDLLGYEPVQGSGMFGYRTAEL